MRQGSILAFLQPISPAPKAELVVEQPTCDHDIVKEVRSSIASEVPRSEVKTTVVLSDPKACISPVCAWHVSHLQAISSALFPVRYSEKFFKECLEPDESSTVAFVALYDSKPVGWIRCRYEPFPNSDNHVYQQLYIQTIGVLAPYRGLGLAKALLDTAINQAQQSTMDVRSTCAHVWERNDDALSWYERQSFKQIMLLPQYYSRLRPAGAYLVRKELVS